MCIKGVRLPDDAATPICRLAIDMFATQILRVWRNERTAQGCTADLNANARESQDVGQRNQYIVLRALVAEWHGRRNGAVSERNRAASERNRTASERNGAAYERESAATKAMTRPERASWRIAVPGGAVGGRRLEHLAGVGSSA